MSSFWRCWAHNAWKRRDWVFKMKKGVRLVYVWQTFVYAGFIVCLQFAVEQAEEDEEEEEVGPKQQCTVWDNNTCVLTLVHRTIRCTLMCTAFKYSSRNMWCGLLFYNNWLFTFCNRSQDGAGSQPQTAVMVLWHRSFFVWIPIDAEDSETWITWPEQRQINKHLHKDPPNRMACDALYIRRNVNLQKSSASTDTASYLRLQQACLSTAAADRCSAASLSGHLGQNQHSCRGFKDISRVCVPQLCCMAPIVCPALGLDPAAAGTNPRLFWTQGLDQCARPTICIPAPYLRQGCGCCAEARPYTANRQSPVCKRGERINTSPFEAAPVFNLEFIQEAGADMLRL